MTIANSELYIILKETGLWWLRNNSRLWWLRNNSMEDSVYTFSNQHPLFARITAIKFILEYYIKQVSVLATAAGPAI